jgi:hypothetical protein
MPRRPVRGVGLKRQATEDDAPGVVITGRIALIVSICLITGVVTSGCRDEPRTTSRIAVEIDEAGDPDSRRPGLIVDRYGSSTGTWTVELAYETSASTAGGASSTSSTVVVFEIVGDAAKIKRAIAAEPYVLAVSDR